MNMAAINKDVLDKSNDEYGGYKHGCFVCRHAMDDAKSKKPAVKRVFKYGGEIGI
ncbi:hypothetical protein [Thalassotalea sp. PS06]|uniref:hypothetical protein n=1 Tax=Thalassotalea sp. PS06 TaxID=2594005 RepID=UPI00163DD1D1|nr:hypothetical protein [Thalassotalea sp. PS06]